MQVTEPKSLNILVDKLGNFCPLTCESRHSPRTFD